MRLRQFVAVAEPVDRSVNCQRAPTSLKSSSSCRLSIVTPTITLSRERISRDSNSLSEWGCFDSSISQIESGAGPISPSSLVSGRQAANDDEVLDSRKTVIIGFNILNPRESEFGDIRKEQFARHAARRFTG